MPSSWSSRFLHTPNSAGTPNRNARVPSRDRPPPGASPGLLDTPTLAGRDGERAAASSPPRQQGHSRSTSNPLPKFFGKKKSTGNLNGYQEDLQLDEDLVPVLDDVGPASPSRKGSGKKKAAEDDGKVARKCMCCDSRVNVPKQVEKFRCMNCLTINDLNPLEDQKGSDAEKDRRASKRPESFPPVLPKGVGVPALSVEHTQSIIDRCVMTYLEARCRPQEDRPLRRMQSPIMTPEEKENPMNTLSTRQWQDSPSGRQLKDALVTDSPPDTPELDGTPIEGPANSKDFPMHDQSSSRPLDTPPPESHGPPHALGLPASAQRKGVPPRPNRKPPPPPMSMMNRSPSQKLNPNSNLAPNGEYFSRPQPSPRLTPQEIEQWNRYERVKTIFRPLEDYIISSFSNFKCLNSSFSTQRPFPTGRTRSESNIVTPPPERSPDFSPSPTDLSQLDAKTLLLGDIGENSTWWTGKLSERSFRRKKVASEAQRSVSSRSPNMNWAELNKWYDLVHSAGQDWQTRVDRVNGDAPGFSTERLHGLSNEDDIEDDLTHARDHAIRALLKVTENLLKRPSRLLKEPDDLRFLLIILANPSLYPSSPHRQRLVSDPRRTASGKRPPLPQRGSPKEASPQKSPGRDGPAHTGIVKRIFGLLSGSSDVCHRYLIGWFTRFDEEHFTKIVDLTASFVNHRISRRSSRPQSKTVFSDGGLIPDLSGSAMSTSAQLHTAMGLGGSIKKLTDDSSTEPSYASDWQVKAAAKVMSLLFAANNIWQGRRRNEAERVDSAVSVTPQAKARRSGQLLHTSYFYNTLLDYLDVIADFKVWESKKDKFAFCQYPMFLSMGSKIKVLEYDARRQMEIKAREAYFSSMLRQQNLESYFHLRVRRDCMVDDSLRQISEAVGSGQEELKKGLRVHFAGEEGVDAGGLRKEWFLMLVRDIFDPKVGLFVYDDDSNTCYFNPNSFETSDQYFLVGALLGLAIYNSTILDIALPPFAFRKLLAAAPASATSSANIASLTGTKGQMTYTLSDLAEFRPSLAAGLQHLLDFDGDVQETYCRDFVAPVERYGTVVNVPLVSNGESIPVTNKNRQDFVDAYVRYLLDSSVSRQFEPFKRGFFQVCAGNALSLFRAEEIELLVRGSDEALDVDSLRAVAVYENWKQADPPHTTIPNPVESVAVIKWFWELFTAASPERQRKLLTFVTGTDRIPAVGATSLILRILAGGDGFGGGGKEERARFPIARTCFNMIILYPYLSKEELERKLWMAVEESEGFALK